MITAFMTGDLLDDPHVAKRKQRTVVLTMPESAAQSLLVMYSGVGGHPGFTPRGHCEDVTDALREAGVRVDSMEHDVTDRRRISMEYHGPLPTAFNTYVSNALQVLEAVRIDDRIDAAFESARDSSCRMKLGNLDAVLRGLLAINSNGGT